MISLGELAARLDKPRKIGQNKLIARCPAHDDKSPSLSITYVDNKILMHCFSGCEISDVLTALGLSMSDLMPERINISSKNRYKLDAYSVLQCLKAESLIVRIAAHQMLRNEPFSETDLARLEQAYEKIDNACMMTWGR